MLLVLKNMCFFRGFWNRTPLIIFIIFALTSPNYWHKCLFAGQSVIFTLVLSWTFFSNLTVSVCLVTFDLIQHLILLSFIYLHNIWTISRITVLDQIKHCFFFLVYVQGSWVRLGSQGFFPGSKGLHTTAVCCKVNISHRLYYIIHNRF